MSFFIRRSKPEKGGVEIYRTALQCAINEDLKEEWEEYLE